MQIICELFKILENSYLEFYNSENRQIICQDAQLNKLYLLVTLVGILVKLKLPVLIKLNKMAENKWKL